MGGDNHNIQNQARNQVKKERPLSPHLSIYKPLISWVPSIIHRATGVMLVVTMLTISWWVISLAIGSETYNCTNRFLFGSLIGELIITGILFSVFFHMFNGIRYLFWAFGLGFDLENMKISAWAAIIGSAFFTVLSWVVICNCQGLLK